MQHHEMRNRLVIPQLSSSARPLTSSSFHWQDPTKQHGLTKQTYSAYVAAPDYDGSPKKWHLTVRSLPMMDN